MSGLFDSDSARPGDPTDDLAYAALWAMPVNVRPPSRPVSKAELARAESLLDGYGWTWPLDVIDRAITRHEQAIDEVEWLGSHGHEPHATWLDQGWPQRRRDDLDTVR